MTEQLISIQVGGTVAEVSGKLRAELERRGVNLFAEIDHAEAARGVGLDMRETRVLLFGNPAAGTPLMQTNETVALALPLKALIYAGDSGTQVAYQPLKKQASTFGLDPGIPILSKLDGFMVNLVETLS